MREVALFPPFSFQPDESGIENWQKTSKKKWTYAPNGRAAIFHIVKALQIKRILIPSYLCFSVMEGLRSANVDVFFLDVKSDSVTPSVADLEKFLQNNKVDAVLWACLYGQPENLMTIEDLCKKYDVKLIDDAAQSFGATVNGRSVGEFGHAGFFSFSPGKATSGPMGSFFWTNPEYNFSTTKHTFFHQIKYFDFFNNRYDQKRFLGLSYLFSRLASFFTQKSFYYSDSCESFETAVLGGILHRETHPQTHELRRQRFIELEQLFTNYHHAIIIKTDVRFSNPHKFVLVFKNSALATQFGEHLTLYKIRYGKGYSSLSESCVNATALKNRVIELPILNDHSLSQYLLQTLQIWLSKN